MFLHFIETEAFQLGFHLATARTLPRNTTVRKVFQALIKYSRSIHCVRSLVLKFELSPFNNT